MSKDNRLCCDECFTLNTDVPIIEKPMRVGYRSKVISLNQNNEDGRSVDNICLDCLEEDINRMKTDWF